MIESTLLWAGPVLRRVTQDRIAIWLVTSSPVEVSLSFYPEHSAARHFATKDLAASHKAIKAGDSVYFQLIEICLDQPLPLDEWIGYDLGLNAAGTSPVLCHDCQPWLCYPGRERPGFVIQSEVNALLHGSCRKPHHESGDGLLEADRYLAEQEPQDWPAFLMHSGDQIYADDVATPMLVAIHQLIPKLGFATETFEQAGVKDSNALHGAQAHYLDRQSLLPAIRGQASMAQALFGGARKPIFTSDHAQNHLISLAEVLSMYLLVWSPTPWEGLEISRPESLTGDQATMFEQELALLEGFRQGLKEVQRVMAHIPNAMMFDDHDVTDDWNLSAAWEMGAYAHGFSRRIIGNALLGFLLCQAWGNAPEQVDHLLPDLEQSLANPGGETHQELIEQVFRFGHWHFEWPTQPGLLVLDTRTHRWRSERLLTSPSGLMDWEALTDLQHQLLGRDAVILVSPAPVFGVKLIEVIQRIFTWFGHPLVIDAENWMAHPGSANTLLNMFRHPRTPAHFVILSGDVHYSFVYQVKLRGHRGGPDIWQITSSGLKNEFPRRLLDVLDRLNRWLYAPSSPLNWFTRRRRMKVVPHKPLGAAEGERLLNASGIGLVCLNPDGSVARVEQLCSDGRIIEFEQHVAEARWD